jgi:hypothetical protein
MDHRIEWITKLDPIKLTRVGKLFQTVGIQVPRKLEEALDETFKTTQDGRSSFKALKDLKQFRMVPKEKWQEWNKLVRSRFKEELEEQELQKEGNK